MDELDVEDITVQYWTDSMTVLKYLAQCLDSDSRVFVAHRVQQIQDISDVNAWNYVPSEIQPC